MTLDTRLGGHEMNHGETESVGLRLRPVNVAYGVNSAAADAYVKQAGLRGAGTRERDVLAQGFRSHRRWNLHDYGGKLIPGLTYQNFFLGGQDHWQQADITNIDDALRAAMTDTGLEGIMAQYWRGASAQVDTLNRIRLDSVEPALSFYTDDVERLVVQLARSGQFRRLTKTRKSTNAPRNLSSKSTTNQLTRCTGSVAITVRCTSPTGTAG